MRGSAQLLGGYLRDYEGVYDDPYAATLAAYNAGPGAVSKYHGVPPYAETHEYIADIYDRWARVEFDRRGERPPAAAGAPNPRKETEGCGGHLGVVAVHGGSPGNQPAGLPDEYDLACGTRPDRAASSDARLLRCYRSPGKPSAHTFRRGRARALV